MSSITLSINPNCEERSEVLDLVRTLTKNMEHIMASLDDILLKVQAESAVDDSIISLLSGIKGQLDLALKGVLSPEDQNKVDALFASVSANIDKVQAAVTANTPAVPAPPVAPPVDVPPAAPAA